MSKKLTATIFGAGASLCGVIVWVLLSLIGFIAGIAGALMGIAFLLAYKKYNPDDESKYPHIVASSIIVIDIIIAELITIAIIAAPYSVPLIEAMQIPEIFSAVIFDVLVGLLLSFFCYFGYLASQKRKKQNEKILANYNQSLRQISQQNTVESDEYQKAISIKRKITIIREKRFSASLVKINYICDGAIVATAKNGETVTFELDGRQHSLCATMQMAQSPMMLIEADSEDKTYIVKLKSKMSGMDLFLEKH